MRALTTFGCLLLISACGGGTPPPQMPDAAPSTSPDMPGDEAPGDEVPGARTSPPEPEPDAEPNCDDRAEPMAPIMLTPAQWDARRGAGATKLSELKTTKQDPAQACNPAHSYRWLSTLTCDDGTRPLAGPDEAADARTGNVGPGGKCGNIIDLYRVHCPEPEGDVDVYIDMYWCTEAILAPPPQGA